MSDVFISYARQDRPRAEIFARVLHAYGWSVFWDRTIRAGGTWRGTIGNELQSARCVLVLWSKDSVESDWVQEEADDAKQRRVLVPVLIGRILPPIGFRSVQCADLSDWDGAQETQAFQRLISDIVALIGPSPKEVEEERRRQGVAEATRAAAKERQRAEAEHFKQEEEKRRAEENESLREKAESARQVAEERQRREAAQAERVAEEKRKRGEEEGATEPLNAMGRVAPAVQAAWSLATSLEVENPQKPVDEKKASPPMPAEKSKWLVPVAITAVVALGGAAVLGLPEPRPVVSIAPNVPPLHTINPPATTGIPPASIRIIPENKSIPPESTVVTPEAPRATQAVPSVPPAFPENGGFEKSVALQLKIDTLKSAAARGDGHAANQLGRMYYVGEGGVGRDYKKALQFYQRASDLGIDDAYVAMAVIWALGGHGVDQDSAKAEEYILKAHGSEFSAGAYILGNMYERGSIVRQDLNLACKYYRMGAKKNDDDAIVGVSRVCGKGGTGKGEDLQSKIARLTKAADAKDADAARQLATIYDLGEGGAELDGKKALALYQRAADLGEASVFISMARIYKYGGNGVEQDSAKAVQFYLKAINKGVNLAAYLLGRMYEDGDTVRQDVKSACKYYRMGDQNDEDIKAAERRVCGKGVTK